MAELHIIFLRHGFSIANLTKQTSFIGVLRDHGGSLRFSQSVKNSCCRDASLTMVGKRQGRAAGGRLSKVFDPLIRLHKEEVFSSGLTRTVQTAIAFIDGYNEYQQQFTKRITPLPYISEQRIRWWCCCADLDNQVQGIDTIREAVQRDDIEIEPIRPLDDPTSLPWRKPNVRMFQTQVIPVLGERIGQANAVIVVSHKKTIAKITGKTLQNGEMVVQTFNRFSGEKMGPPRMIQGQQAHETTLGVEGRLKKVLGQHRRVTFYSY